MALNKNDLVQLMKVAMTANASAPTAYSFNGASLDYSAVQDTLREELNALCATPALYRENQNLIFQKTKTDSQIPPKNFSVCRMAERNHHERKIKSIFQNQ